VWLRFIWTGTTIMMKILSLVMAAAWFVGQVSSAASLSDDPSFLSNTDNNNNEDNNIMITDGPVELRNVIIMHSSGTTATIKKKSAGSSEASRPGFPTTYKTTTSMVVDGNDDDTYYHHQQQHHQQQHDWVSQPPPPPAQKERRQLQTVHQQACDLMYDNLIGENSGASCECKGGAGTFTCVNPPECYKFSASCRGAGGDDDDEPVCFVVTTIYDFVIKGDTVLSNAKRTVLEYTSGGASIRGKEIQDVGTDRCYWFMTTLDGLRYQCNDCSPLDCPGDDEINVDCSNIQADSTTRGQCVSLNKTAMGLLNDFCVEGPIVPTTLPVTSAAGFLQKKVLLAITAVLTCSLLMITCCIIASLNRTRRERTVFAITVGEQQQLV
jgi:hypothetical protein